jgi:long-chain fatty acid transport protein
MKHKGWTGSRVKLRRVVSFGTLVAVLGAAPAWGAGFGLKEHSADAMAAAYAGAAATDRDAGYMAYNPAALAGVVSDDMSADMVVILSGSKGDYTSATTSAGTPAGGSPVERGFISDALVPALGLRHRVSNKIAIGLEISAPWGLKTDFPSTWAGRYYAQKTQLLTINIAPAVSYQPTDTLSFGAALQVEFAQGLLTSAIDTGTLGMLNGIPGSVPGAQDSFARLSGKSWTLGYSLGAIWRPAAGVAVGVAYRSSMQHDLKGPLTFTLDSAGVGAAIRAFTGAFANTRQTTPVTIPDVITSGARMDFSDAWSGMIEIDWTHWSRFRGITVLADNPAQPPDVTTMRWHDTLFGSIGFEYRADADWSFRAGAAYDESPVPDATREPRIPDSDRIWISAGVRHRLGEHLDLDITASRLFFRKSDVAITPAIPGAALRGSLNGSTEAYVNVVGFGLNWRAN